MSIPVPVELSRKITRSEEFFSSVTMFPQYACSTLLESPRDCKPQTDFILHNTMLLSVHGWLEGHPPPRIQCVVSGCHHLRLFIILMCCCRGKILQILFGSFKSVSSQPMNFRASRERLARLNLTQVCATRPLEASYPVSMSSYESARWNLQSCYLGKSTAKHCTGVPKL